MRTIVIFYRGTELPNLTKSMIAKQLIEAGVDINSIDMTTFDDEETASIFTNAVKNVKVDDITILETKKEELHLACVYLKAVKNINECNNEGEFIIKTLEYLHSVNNDSKEKLSTAFRIIAANNQWDVTKEGLRASAYNAIVKLVNHNLI